MRPVRSHTGAGYLAIVLLCLLYPFNTASADGNREPASGVPRPAIARGLGETCVADNDFMRRNHMDMLKHQRDETVFKGLRDEAFSLRDCISCHVVEGADGMAVTVSDPQHFCRTCHDYTAVDIDCFQCHASRPESAGQSGAN